MEGDMFEKKKIVKNPLVPLGAFLSSWRKRNPHQGDFRWPSDGLPSYSTFSQLDVLSCC